MLPQMKKNADGSADDLHPEQDAGEGQTNPIGFRLLMLPFYVLLRLYWPKETPPSILPPGEGTWNPPGVVQVK